MKNYNNYNYSRYKADLKASMPENKNWHEYKRDELIIKFLPLVENIARKFSTADSAIGVMNVTDLIAMGHIGLIQAVDKITWKTILESKDPERTIKSYFAKRIKGSIRRGTDTNRGSMRIPEHKLNEIRQNFDKDKSAVEMFFNSIFTSIDALNDDDYVFDIPDQPSEANNETLNKYLMDILAKHLNKKEYDVVRMSFGLDCDKYSASEIAEHLGIKGTSSYVRVSQLKKQAIDKLSRVVDHSQVTDYL